VRNVMTYVEPPSLKSSDDLEGLLRAFFASQMPKPWPSPRVPSRLRLSERPSLSPKRPSLIRSRWALAASVALLFLGSLLLPSRFTENAKPKPFLNAPGTADRSILPPQSKQHETRSDKNDPRLPGEDEDHLPEMDDGVLPFMK